MRRVLNVGGHSRDTPLPPCYDGWQQVLLDIDASSQPDILCDARRLSDLAQAGYDAVYCSHNLEHYYRHDAVKVLEGFLHVLKDDGFAHIRVPDMAQVMQAAVARRLDIDDVLYEAVAGPISVRDVIYGFGAEIERSGNDFFAHKTGYTEQSLSLMLSRCGFAHVFTRPDKFEIAAFAFLNEPSEFAARILELAPAGASKDSS